LQTLQIGLAGLIALGNMSPVTVSPVSELAVVTPSAQVISETIPELITERADTFGVSKDLALAIAFCESTTRQYDENNLAADGTPKVLRGVVNSADVGIFQINEKYHLERSQSLGYDIYIPEGNIDYAMSLLKEEGSKHWKASEPCWGNKINQNV
jgi:hypothetical protein